MATVAPRGGKAQNQHQESTTTNTTNEEKHDEKGTTMMTKPPAVPRCYHLHIQQTKQNKTKRHGTKHNRATQAEQIRDNQENSKTGPRKYEHQYCTNIMHTLWVRLNAVVFFGLTVLLGLSCLAAVSKIGHSLYYKPVIHNLEIRKLRSLKSHGGVDRALLSFDIHADMAPAFHWNIKQLFVYVVASYETPNKKINQIVVWDKIIEAIDPNKVIEQENLFVKYALVDQGKELRGKDITLQLMWDHMPTTGLLYQGRQDIAETTSFVLPNEYQ